MSTSGFSRRIVFQGLGALGVAAALAGCSTGGGGQTTETVPGDALVASADVPVGGGIVLTDVRIVVTQPTAGEFKAFTAICTHEGNTVGKVENGTITCLVHGSEFSAETGEAESGPASRPLEAIAVKVDGDQIVAA